MILDNLAKVEVAGSNPVSRSKIFKGQIDDLALFYYLISASYISKPCSRHFCLHPNVPSSPFPTSPCIV